MQEQKKTSVERLAQSSLLQRLFVVVLTAFATALLGTMIHRGGVAMGLPWGLLFAFFLIIVSATLSRIVLGLAGIGLHLIITGGVVMFCAGVGPGGDVVMPALSAVLGNPLSQLVAYAWIFGMIIIQIIMLCLPKKLFKLPE